MREIKFRGKLVNEDKLVYGSLLSKKGKFYITPIDNSIGYQIQEVIPHTVGQYTGLVDCKGNEIYEGDNINVIDEDETGLDCDTGNGNVEFYDGIWYVNGNVHNGLYDLDKQYYFEVISNIHEQ